MEGADRERGEIYLIESVPRKEKVVKVGDREFLLTVVAKDQPDYDNKFLCLTIQKRNRDGIIQNGKTHWLNLALWPEIRKMMDETASILQGAKK